LQDEGIIDVQAFGTLQVVPIGESLSAGFRFALPVTVLQIDPSSGQTTYHLKVQKQPGTLAWPITIRIHLPSGAKIHTTPDKAVVQNNNILFETNLRTDVELEVTFSNP
jgi:hypothetical protein